MIVNFKSWIFFIRIFIVFSIRIRCNVNWFHFNASMNCVVEFINNIIKHFFEMAAMCLKILLFNVLMNLSATTGFPSLYVQYISVLFILKKNLKELLYNSPHWSFHILFGFLRFEIVFWNALTILIPLLSFEGTTHAYFIFTKNINCTQ